MVSAGNGTRWISWRLVAAAMLATAAILILLIARWSPTATLILSALVVACLIVAVVLWVASISSEAVMRKAVGGGHMRQVREGRT